MNLWRILNVKNDFILLFVSQMRREKRVDPTVIILLTRDACHQKVGTCESAVSVRIEYGSNRALRFEFESNLESFDHVPTNIKFSNQ